MDNSSRKKILNRKKQRKIMARKDFFSHNAKKRGEEDHVLEESIVAKEEAPVLEDNAIIGEVHAPDVSVSIEDYPGHDDNTTDEETSVLEENILGEEPTSSEEPLASEDTTTEDTPVIADNAIPDDIDRLLKKIKMEITFSDDSSINREIVISGDEWKPAKAPEENPSGEAKMPWFAAVILACIVCASFATGIFHWYNTYYNPMDPVEPAYVGQGGERSPDDNVNNPVIINTNDPTKQDAEEPDQPDQTTGHRYGIEPLPEFLVLWEEYGNEDIVAVLTLGETEILVVQGNDNAFYIAHDINRNPSPHGWVFLDHQVDIYMGLEYNMVLYDPVGEFLRQVIQEYADYDFFLRNPTILLSTLYGDFDWEIFSFYIAPSDFPFSIIDHPDDDIWGEIVEQFTKASLYNTRLDVNMEDQVLTIAVPTTIDPELFYILQARMLRQITS